MRKIIVAIFSFIVLGIVAAKMIQPDDRPVPEVFKEAMNFAHWLTYSDPYAGYSFYYPSFMTKEKDDGRGNVSFGYHNNNIDLVLELRIDSINTTSPSHDYFIDGLSAKDSDVIRTGQEPDMDGYHFYSHYVRHDNLWYILTIYYPYSCKDGAARIIYSVKEWRPFERKKLKLFTK